MQLVNEYVITQVIQLRPLSDYLWLLLAYSFSWCWVLTCFFKLLYVCTRDGQILVAFRDFDFNDHLMINEPPSCMHGNHAQCVYSWGKAQSPIQDTVSIHKCIGSTHLILAWGYVVLQTIQPAHHILCESICITYTQYTPSYIQKFSVLIITVTRLCVLNTISGSLHC